MLSREKDKTLPVTTSRTLLVPSLPAARRCLLQNGEKRSERAKEPRRTNNTVSGVRVRKETERKGRGLNHRIKQIRLHLTVIPSKGKSGRTGDGPQRARTGRRTKPPSQRKNNIAWWGFNVAIEKFH